MPKIVPYIATGDAPTLHSFITLRGQVQVLATTLAEVTRPGVTGHAYREQGGRGEPFVLTGVVDCNDLDEAGLSAATMAKDFQGKVVRVKDDFGRVHFDLACLQVRREESFKLLKAVGGVSGLKGAMLVMSFTLQPTKASRSVAT